MPTNSTAPSVGDVQRFTATIRDLQGAPSTSATVRLLVRDPSGNVDVYTASTIVATTLGTYFQDVTFDEAGDWRWRFESTGDVVASTGGRVAVRPSHVSTGG